MLLMQFLAVNVGHSWAYYILYDTTDEPMFVVMHDALLYLNVISLVSSCSVVCYKMLSNKGQVQAQEQSLYNQGQPGHGQSLKKIQKDEKSHPSLSTVAHFQH